MSKHLVALALALVAMLAQARQETPALRPNTEFAIIKTADVSAPEALVFSGGSYRKSADTVFSAVLVRHGNELVLFDSGLGSGIAEQYHQDMPLYDRPFFRYRDPVVPVRAQLDKAGIGPVGRIILSHAHWDHASGIPDFPGAEVWAAAEEMIDIHRPAGGVGGTWPSQVSSPGIRWKTIAFNPVPYEGFEQSLDLFSDGSVVLVPMFGHTHGSIGMFVNVGSGKRYFFIGDVVWNAGALASGSPKFWLARVRVDQDAARTQAVIDRVRALMAARPDIVVVPAHDGAVQKSIGFFPAWVR